MERQITMATTTLHEAIRRVPQSVIEADQAWWDRAIELNVNLSLGATIADVYAMFAEHPCYCDELVDKTRKPCASCLSQDKIAKRLVGSINYR